jgi:hypothetical protein
MRNAMLPEEGDRVTRVDRPEHVGPLEDPVDAEAPDRREPDQDGRTEHGPDARRPESLREEEADQDPDRDRQDSGLREEGRRDPEPFHRTEHGDRRRDDAVAVEERRAEQPEGDVDGHHPLPVRAARLRLQKCEEREDASLTTVVRAHDEGEVLDDDHERERPEEERLYAEHVRPRHLHAVRKREALTNGVERRGADVTVDDAERAQRQLRQVEPALDLRGVGDC